MKEEKIIQENLFAITNESYNQISPKVIAEDLSTEELKKDSKKRPRQRGSSPNLGKNLKTNINLERKNDFINEKSYSYKTVAKPKLTPVIRHYVTLKEENKDRLLLYRLGDFFECFFEDAVLVSQILEII